MHTNRAMPLSAPTQTRHPWRATARTVLAAALALLPVLPEIADAAGLYAYPLAASVLAIAATVTRVLALPKVDGWLRKYLPWLAAQPR